MNDKTRFADEMLRTLRPGGYLALADWNSRDLNAYPPSFIERLVLKQLLEQWVHLIKIVQEELFLKIGILIQTLHGTTPLLKAFAGLSQFCLLDLQD